MVKRKNESDSSSENGSSESDLSSEEESPAPSSPTPSSPTTKKVKLSKEKLYKPPTSEELANLKETQNLYQSGIFRLKMQELISEVQLSEKKRKTLTSLLHNLNDALSNLPDEEINDLTDTTWIPRDITIPMQWKKTQVKGQTCFQKPASIKVVGSFLLDTCLRSDLNVNIAVGIPKSCLHQKDYLNFRYHHKRALYCVYLVKHLRKNKLIQDIQYGLANEDKLRPVVVIRFVDKSAKKLCVRLYPCVGADEFKETRFLPDKSNIRKQWYIGQEGEEENIPTPSYNSSILADMNLERHLHHLHNTSVNFKGYKEGMFLLKVWLHQRGLDKGCGAFNGFIMSMLVSYLVAERKIHKVMSGYQVMRNTLLYLANNDWSEKGVSMCTDPERRHAEYITEFHQHFDVVFIDPSGYLNLCACMTKTTYKRVCHEAKLAMECLDNKVIDAFDILFMTEVPFCRKFDHLFQIHNLKQLVKSCKNLNCEDKLMETGEAWIQVVLPGVIELLKKALGNRLHILDVMLPQCKQWPVTSGQPSSISKEDTLTFGLLLNPEFSTSILDKGPAANAPEAAAFREFWGDKSELRRFQDTSICEAVVWPGSTVAEKRLVCQHVVKHVLHKHAGIDPSTVTYLGGSLDEIISIPSMEKTVASGEEENVAVIQAYTSLSKCLRNLNGLPLTITSVQGVSPVFRYAEVFPPSVFQVKKTRFHHADQSRVQIPSSKHKCPEWVPVLSVLCQMEGSGKWPDNLAAIQRIKAAFLIRIGELMSKQHQVVTATTAAYVDVVQDGYVFRVKVAHKKEIGLAKETKTPTGLVTLKDNVQSMHLEKEIVQLPRLTSMLHGVQQQYNTYGNTVRLAKRWVCAHLLSRHISQECVELMVAHLYLHPAPYSTPSSPMAGFLRFLHLLSSHDWKSSPLIVNMNSELQDGDYDEIRDHFSHHRSQLPVMFVATPIDKLSSVWTRHMPTAQILQRLTILAQESLTVLQTQLITNSRSLDTKQVFRPPLEPYDVIIHLSHQLLPRLHHAVDVPDDVRTRHDGAASVTIKELTVVNFDPVNCYVNELEATYGEMALFFHDEHGGDFIAVLWKPGAFKPQPFTVKHVQGKIRKDTSAGGKDPELIPNLEAIIEDFQILGEGLVQSVQVRTHNIDKWI